MSAEKVTPLPWRKLAVLGSILVSESVAMTMLFPVIPFLIRRFPEVDGSNTSQVTFFASILGCTFQMAQFVSSFWWGALSDTIGRKPVLLMGLACAAVTSVLFGCCSTFVAAVVVRGFSGLLNGNVPVAKTYMREITDSTNQGRGFALFGTIYGVGSIIGPAVGGYLSFPADKLPWLFSPDSIFGTYPFLLPSMCSSAVSLFGFVMGFFWLTETYASRYSLQSLVRTLSMRRNAAQLEAVADVSQVGPASNAPACCGREGLQTLRRVLSVPGVVPVVVGYAILCFIVTSTQELFPLWASSSVTDGGLAFDTTELGNVNMWIGCCLVVYGTFILPRFIRRFGEIRVFRYASASWPAILFSLPLLTYLDSQRYAMWPALIFISTLRSVGGTSAFTTIGLLINNSVAKDVGALNGFAQSVVSFTRGLAPFLAGSLLSWCQHNGLPFPLNYSLPWILLALLAVCNILTSFRFPNHLNQRAEETQEVLLEDVEAVQEDGEARLFSDLASVTKLRRESLEPCIEQVTVEPSR